MDEYRLGDQVRLRPKDDAVGRLLVGGWPVACPRCHADFSEGEEIVTVEIVDGQLRSVRTATGEERRRFLLNEVVRQA